MQDCTQDDNLCPAGTVCDENKNCSPGEDITACEGLEGECSPAYPLGACEEGSTCYEGACYTPPEALVIGSDPTFMLKTDIFWFGFLYTTASFSTRFNDQFNVFRPGTTSQVVGAGDADIETIVFTDPESGISYAATQPRCEQRVFGGHVGLCGACEVSEDCVGFSQGFYGEVFCVDLEGTGEGSCVQDCTYDASLCGPGFSCEADTGNCIPAFGSCGERDCAPDVPQGGCEEGFTCYEGACTAPDTLSPQCAISGGADRVGVRMVRHGQALASDYLEASEELVSFDGTDAEYDALITRFYRSRFYLRSHVELLETLRATYSIFGQVY
jgi:hypothetical protein